MRTRLVGSLIVSLCLLSPFAFAQNAKDTSSTSTDVASDADDSQDANAPSSDDAAGNDEAAAPSGASTQVQKRQTPDPFADLEGRPDARSMTMQELQEAFGVSFDAFQNYLAESDETSPNTQTGYRSRVRTVGAAMEVRDILREILERSELSEDDRVQAQDSYLTVQQVMGSIMVDIEECRHAIDVLEPLESNPEAQSRTLLYKGITRWLAKARRCDERQALEAQISARDAAEDAEELERLRTQLAQTKSQEAEADRAEAQDADSLVMSRGELLDLLRQSADSRRKGSAFEELFGEQRKGLPTHEYGVSLYGGFAHTPNFIIRMTNEEGMRVEPKPSARFGGAVFIRKNARKRDISLNYDYAAFDFGEHWWISKYADKWKDARYAYVGKVPVHTLSVAIDRNFVAGKKERFHFFVGGLFGLAFLPTNGYDRDQPLLGPCTSVAGRVKAVDLERFAPGGGCYDASMREPASSGPYKFPLSIGNTGISPTIGLRLGARYVIADLVQVGVGGGFESGFFYGDLSLGFIFARKYKDGDGPENAPW